MAQNTNISLTTNTWVQLTNADVTAVRVANLGSEPVFIQATVGAVAPSNTQGALPLAPGQVLAADLTLSQLWPGVAGANRVYALAPNAAQISLSHA